MGSDKKYGSIKNKPFRITDVEKLIHEAFHNIIMDNWNSCVEHAKQIL